MRNLFDQYLQPENRLTHALLCSLDADRRLLQSFIRWSAGVDRRGASLTVQGQSLPGQLELAEDEADRKGIPDGCISDGEGWAVLIESKVGARWNPDQLRRHRATALRHGLTDVLVLCLTSGRTRQEVPAGCVARTWPEVYGWLHAQVPSSKWARRGRDYFEVAEAKLLEREALREGAITMFSGIPFSEDEPYTYLQAKRVLGLLREELLAHKELRKRLNIDPENAGRGAITGTKSRRVWDYIGLMGARGADGFTSHPHLTLGVHDDKLEAMLTLPNGMPASRRRAMLGDQFESFQARVGDVTAGMMRAIGKTSGAKPIANVVQRHYASQRSEPVYDAVLRFDPRTAIAIGKEFEVKSQPQWLRAAFDSLDKRRSNLQFQIGVEFGYDRCPAVRSEGIAEMVAQVWLACEPMLTAAR
jgi:hypothetical protein